MPKLTTTFIIMFLFSIFWPHIAQANYIFQNDALKLEIIPQYSQVNHDISKIPFNVVFKLKKGYHIYYKDPGEIGKPTTFTFKSCAGTSAYLLKWPKPEVFKDSGFTTNGYENTVIFPCVLNVDKGFKDKNCQLQVNVSWLACKNSCVPGSATLDKEIIFDNKLEINQSFLDENSQSSDNYPKKVIVNQNSTIEILGFIAMAFIGGIILNFMPCVLPVVGLKIFNIIEEAGSDIAKIRQQSLVFCSGIWFSFAVLSSTIIWLQHIGQNIGWGFQFQSNAFLLFMIILIIVLSLSLFGIFYIDLPLPTSTLNKLSDKSGNMGHFFSGILATCLSTPCTAPFLGSALGFAFSQPAYISFMVFMSIGLGMSSPYLLISVNPKFVKLIPKPGLWMDTLKQSMGFIMLFTAIWLMSVLASKVNSAIFINLLYFINILSFAIYIKSKLLDLNSTTNKKLIVNLVFYASLILFANYLLKPILSSKNTINEQSSQSNANEINYIPYTPQIYDSIKNTSKIVFMDFTAKWCLTCQANENLVLKNKLIVDAFKNNDITAIKFDWTDSNPAITNLIKSYGRSGVPLYVFVNPNDRQHPIVLPEIITPQIIIDTINQIKNSKLTSEVKP